MTGKSQGRYSLKWLGAGGVIGLALIAAALMLAWPAGPGAPVVSAQPTETSTPTATSTPTVTPTATPNDGCILKISKSDSPTTVPEGGQITYTIRVENDDDGTEDCAGVDVTDTIPDNTDCVSASVESAPSGFDIDDVDIDGCDASGTVEWDFGTDSDEELEPDDQVVLEMVVELTSGADEGDEIDNEACVDATDETEVCDDETTDVGAPATPTATNTPVVVPTVTPYVPPLIVPETGIVPAAAAPVVAPSTGTGSASGGGGMTDTLALALGLAGGAVLLASGVAALRARRVR